ncbi:hypothetical protein THUN1379_21110 [Paludibacterium sp. THUN1379]|uniref:hypothetical protein n=1 Tax=Paludibacterium sp. THUN1379 TaxID=3112107 RepID=UPI00309298FE|nr:hypothetical protein THUN1379_21110 [Paludibacterium sp. THUN1379]
MLVFLDTEFTAFHNPDLISIALVSEHGHEFYAERTDFRREDCTDFVLQTVLPLLGRIPGAACTLIELSDRLRRWFDGLPEPATVVFDFQTDWDLLLRALVLRVGDVAPKNLKDKLLISPDIENSPFFAEAYLLALNSGLPEHHALGDARALRNVYQHE